MKKKVDVANTELKQMDLIRFRTLVNNSNVDTYALTNKDNVMLGMVTWYSNGRTKNYVSFTLFHKDSFLRTQGKSSDSGAGRDFNIACALEHAVIRMIAKLKSEEANNLVWDDEKAIEQIRNINIPEMCDEHKGIFYFRDIGLRVRYMMGCL